ncbi:MAG: hypothetical protein ACFE8T_14720, partial [Promethearchaeota archaeon]
MKFIAFFEFHIDKLDSVLETWSETNQNVNNLEIYPFHILAESYREITGFVIFKSETILNPEIGKFLAKYV